MEIEEMNKSIRNTKSTNLNIKLKPNNPNIYRNTNTLSFKSKKSINLINKSSKKIPNNAYIKKLEREQYYKYSSSQDTSSKENSYFLEEESNKGCYFYNNNNNNNNNNNMENKNNISIDFNLNKRLSTISNLATNKNKKSQSRSNDKNTYISFKNKIVNINKNNKNTNKEEKIRKQNVLYKLIENYHKAKSKKERQYNIDASIKDHSDNNSDSNKKKSVKRDNNTYNNTHYNTISNNSSNNNPVYSNLSLWEELYSKFVSKNSLKSTKINLDEIKFRIKFTLNNEYFSSDLYNNNNNSNDNNNINNKNDGSNYNEEKETFITSNNKKELLERKNQLINEKNNLVPLIIRLIQQINIDDLVNNEKKEDGNEVNKKEDRVFSYKEFLENRKKKKNFVRSVVNFAGNKSSLCSSIDFSKKNNKSEIIKYKTLGCSSLFNNSVNISKNNSRHRDSISYSLNKLGNNNNNYLNSIINRNNNNNNNMHFSIKSNRVNTSISSFVKNSRINISNISNTRNTNMEGIKSKTNNIPNKNYLKSNTRMNDLFFNHKNIINNKNKLNKRLSKSNKEILQFIDRFKLVSSKAISDINANANTSNINFKMTKSFSKIDNYNNFNYNYTNKTKLNTCEAFRKISIIEHNSINDSFSSNIILDKRSNNNTRLRKSSIKSRMSNSNSKSICISSSSKSNDKSENKSSIINKKISDSEYELVKYESKRNLLNSNNKKSLLRSNKKKVTINTRENTILVTENDKKVWDNSNNKNEKKKLTFTSSLFSNSTHFNNTNKKILNAYASSNLNSNDKDNSTIATNSTILSILSNNNNTKSRIEDLLKKKTIDNIKLKKKLTHINRTKPQRLNSINSCNANDNNNIINNKINNKKLTSHNFNIYSLRKNCKSNTKIINIHSDTAPTFTLDLNSISHLKIENNKNTIIKINKLNSEKKYLSYEDKIKLKDYKLIDQIAQLNFNNNINSINDTNNSNNVKIGNTKKISLFNSNNSMSMNLGTMNANSASNHKLNSSFKKKNSILLSNINGFADSKNIDNHLFSNTNTATNNINNKNIKLSPTQIRININNLESLKMDIKAFEKEINIAESKGLFKLNQYKAIEHLINSEKIKSCLSKMTFKYENTFKTKIGINSNNYGIIFDDMTKPKFHRIFNDEVMLNKLVDCEKIMTIVKKNMA